MAYLQINKMLMAGMAITASLFASTQCFGAFFCDVDALYLKAYEGGLTNLCDQTNTIDTTAGDLSFSSITGHGVQPDFRWDCGYRLGAGYTFDKCVCNQMNCDLGVFWTHYNGKTKGVKNRWKLDYDTVDLLFSCKCPCQYAFTFTPYAGLKFACINQRHHTTFINPTNSVPVVESDFNKQDFEGFGPLLGLGVIWEDECGFGAYGNLDVAFLYGRSKILLSGLDSFNTGTNDFHFRQHRITQQLVVDAGIGVQWKKSFCNKFIVLHFGYEVHRYFDHNQFSGHGDLSLDGLSFGLALEF